jgi:hypothetical protein
MRTQTTPTMGKSILFGRFQKNGLPNFGIVIENVGRTREYTVQFRSTNDVVVIEVEPDTYEITHFIAASFINEIVGRKPLKGWPFTVPFTAAPNAIYYLSDFAGSYNHSFPQVVWTIEQPVDRFDSAKTELLEKFPNLRGLHVQRAFAERRRPSPQPIRSPSSNNRLETALRTRSLRSPGSPVQPSRLGL